mgnify:CR=1 FL=1
MWSSPLIAEAMAQPTACGYCVPRFPDTENMLALALWYMIGSWRPLHMSRVFDRHWHIMSTSFVPRYMYRPWLRYDGKHMSPGRNAMPWPTETASSPSASM